MINQFVNPQIGPRQRSRVFAMGLYSGSDLDTVGIIYRVPNSFSLFNNLIISSSASDGREESKTGKRDWIVLTR